jgi:hypothetical protein
MFNFLLALVFPMNSSLLSLRFVIMCMYNVLTKKKKKKIHQNKQLQRIPLTILYMCRFLSNLETLLLTIYI